MAKNKISARPPPGVIVYCRVSTEDQADRGMSLDAQESKCMQYAKLFDLAVLEVIKETASAKSLNRPLLQAALEKLSRKHASGLLISKLDRLTRSLRDIGSLVSPAEPGIKAGPLSAGRASLYSVTDQIDTGSASGRMVLNLLVTVAQWERETIAERTKAAMQHMRDQGLFTGGHAPYGFDLVDGRLVENAAEVALLQRVTDFLDGPVPPLREIAEVLLQEGFTSRKGGKFLPTQIKRLLLAAERMHEGGGDGA